MFGQLSHNALRKYAAVSLTYFAGSTLYYNYNDIKYERFQDNILQKTLLKKSINGNSYTLLTLAIANLGKTDGLNNFAEESSLKNKERILSGRIITSIAWPLALADFVSLIMLEIIISDNNENPDVFIDYINNLLMDNNENPDVSVISNNIFMLE